MWSKDEEHWVWSRQTCLHSLLSLTLQELCDWVSDVPSLSLSLPTWVSQRAAGRVLHTGAGLVCGRAWRAAATCFLTLASLVLPFRYTWMHAAVCRQFLGLCDPKFILEQPHPRRWALTLEGGGGGGSSGGTRSEDCVPDGRTGPHRTVWASLSGEFKF